VAEWYDDEEIGTAGALERLAERRGLSLEQLRTRRDRALAFLDDDKEGHLSLNELYQADPNLPPVAWGQGLGERARRHLDGCARCQALAESLTEANVARQVTRTASRIWPPPDARGEAEIPAGAAGAANASKTAPITVPFSYKLAIRPRFALSTIGMGVMAAIAGAIAISQSSQIRDLRVHMGDYQKMRAGADNELLALQTDLEATESALVAAHEEIAKLEDDKMLAEQALAMAGTRLQVEFPDMLSSFTASGPDQAVTASMLQDSRIPSALIEGASMGTVSPWKMPEVGFPLITVESLAETGEPDWLAASSPAPFAFSRCDGENVVLSPVLEFPPPALDPAEPACLGGQVSQWLESHDEGALYLQPWVIDTEAVLQR